jgi:hypothetical protein
MHVLISHRGHGSTGTGQDENRGSTYSSKSLPLRILPFRDMVAKLLEDGKLYKNCITVSLTLGRADLGALSRTRLIQRRKAQRLPGRLSQYNRFGEKQNSQLLSGKEEEGHTDKLFFDGSERLNMSTGIYIYIYIWRESYIYRKISITLSSPS